MPDLPINTRTTTIEWETLVAETEGEESKEHPTYEFGARTFTERDGESAIYDGAPFDVE